MTTRRRMLRDLATGVASLAIWPRGSRAQEDETAPPDSTTSEPADTLQTHVAVSIPLASAKELAAIGGSAVVTANGRTLLLARVAETSVLAFESRCTHKQVTLKYDHKNARLNCPAHGSRFDLEGKATKGPAKESLQTYQASLTADAFVVMLPT